MSASQPAEGPRISRRGLFQGAGALGLAAAGSTWLRPASALAAAAADPRHAARPRPGRHLLTDYRPSQPTGWPPQQGHLRNGAGVTIGGHVASARFTIDETTYEVSLVAFGQPGNAPDPVYEPEPADPVIAFKPTLQKAWGEYYSFRYTGGFHGRTAISVQSYSVTAAQQTAPDPQVMFGCDLFLVYQPDPASSDPAITADLRWIQVTNTAGKSSTEFAQRANPYYFPGGLTSVYGTPACSYYGGGSGGIGGKTTSQASAADFSNLTTAESFLVLDTQRKDHAGKGIIDILGGVKWGWQVQQGQA